jgi:hypothetical protein
MKRALLILMLAAATAHARPTFHEADADVSMLVARQVPLTWQPLVLMALDTSLPLVAGVVGAGAGGLLGATLFLASGRSPVVVSAWPVRDTFLTFAAVGALAGGTLSMFTADLLLNTRHLERVFPSRVAWTLLMVPAPLLLVVGTLTQGFGGLPSTVSRVSSVATRGAWLFSVGCVPPLALLLSAWTRARTDERQGSALWQVDEP